MYIYIYKGRRVRKYFVEVDIITWQLIFYHIISILKREDKLFERLKKDMLSISVKIAAKKVDAKIE